MNNTANKREFFYVVVLILTFITVIVGATFAIYALIHRQEEGTSAVFTGTFSIEYLSGEIIDFHYMEPMDVPDLTTTDNIYRNNFRVANKGSLDSAISVIIEMNKNEFSDQFVRYALYNGAEEMVADGYLEGNDDITLAGNIVLESGKIENFVLLIWLEENGEDQNSEMNKSLTGQVVVEALQKLD